MYKALVNIGITPKGPEFAVGDIVPEGYPHLQVLIERGYVEKVGVEAGEPKEGAGAGEPESAEPVESKSAEAGEPKGAEGEDPLKPKRKK